MSVHTLFQTVAIYRIQQSQMLKQTTYLFLKALIIGILVNVALQYVDLGSVSPEKNRIQFEHLEQRQSLKQPPVSTPSGFPKFISP